MTLVEFPLSLEQGTIVLCRRAIAVLGPQKEQRGWLPRKEGGETQTFRNTALKHTVVLSSSQEASGLANQRSSISPRRTSGKLEEHNGAVKVNWEKEDDGHLLISDALEISTIHHHPPPSPTRMTTAAANHRHRPRKTPTTLALTT